VADFGAGEVHSPRRSTCNEHATICQPRGGVVGTTGHGSLTASSLENSPSPCALVISAESIERVPIHTDEDGVKRIAETGVTLDTVVGFDAGGDDSRQPVFGNDCWLVVSSSARRCCDWQRTNTSTPTSCADCSGAIRRSMSIAVVDDDHAAGGSRR
jgi:hypothetical protein